MIVFFSLFVIMIFAGVYKYMGSRRNTCSVPLYSENIFSGFGVDLFFISSEVAVTKLLKIGDFTNKIGGISKIYFGPLAIYVVSSAEEASMVLTQCMEKMFLYNLIKPYVGSELVAASVPVWKSNRRVSDLAFKQHTRIIDKYVEVFNRQASRLSDLLITEVGKEADLIIVITRVMLEIVCQTTMGIKLDGKDVVTDAYAEAIHKVLIVMTERMRHPWLMSDFIFNLSKLKKEQDEALKVIWDLSSQMVQLRKREYLERLRNKDTMIDNEEKPQSYLDILIANTVTEDSSLLTDTQLRQLVDNILLAGFDTTTIELLFCLVCIGSYPKVQKKIYEEIINVLGIDDKLITKQDMQNLIYLEAVIKETLRLYPIGPVILRKADKDIRLKTFTISAGSSVLVHVWALNRNPEYWGSDAEDFKPERWLKQQTMPNHPAAFASFSPGRRNCIGKSYGLTVMKCILAKLLRRYRVKGDHTMLRFELNVLLKPVSGHLITLEMR